MNGDPSIRDLIAEAHAARAAGDMEQVKRALDELQRLTDAASQPELEASQAANPDLAARLAGGVTGAAAGVGDIVSGTVGMGKRFFGLQTPEQTKQFLKDLVKAPVQAVQNMREVTQQYRAGEASPEDVARSWTGGSASVIGPALAALQGSGVDASPRMNLMDPVRAGGRTMAQALRRTEDVVSPRTALYRLRLKQARTAQAARQSAPSSPSIEEPLTGGLTREALERAGVKPENVDHMLELQTRQPSAPEAQPISPGAPGTGLKAQVDPQQTATIIRRGGLEPSTGGTLPRYYRGGQAEQAIPPPPVESPRVQGPASPAIVARRTSYADLQRTLQNPATPGRIKHIILTELQRRGIVGEGLLPPP